jgi:2,3-dihydroxy-p-cumate/2,3-dihydroxybenzoate 3,4-dioxygenase
VIRLRSLRYVRLGTRDVDAAVRFATRLAGLQEIGRMGSAGAGLAAYLRSDARHHTIVYFEGDPGDQRVGFEVADSADLKAGAARLAAAGYAVRMGTRDECAVRNVGAFALLTDPSGNQLELCTPARGTDGEFVPIRHAGVEQFAAVGLRSTDAARDEAFWTAALGALVSDRIGSAPYLRLGEAHHQVALIAARRPGLRHLAFQVAGMDDVMRATYFMRDNGVPILFGPGRDPVSAATFVYCAGPDGLPWAFCTAQRAITSETHRPRQFPVAPRSYCMWGARPVDGELNP